MKPICTHTISVQSSKPSHAYPIIRPREFSGLVGAAATIYQTVHDGAQAFLVVVNTQQDHKLKMGSESKKRLHHGKGRTSFSAQNDRIFGCFDAIEGSGVLLDSGWKLSTCSEKLSTPPQLPKICTRLLFR
jgi:hypothetical protein